MEKSVLEDKNTYNEEQLKVLSSKLNEKDRLVFKFSYKTKRSINLIFLINLMNRSSNFEKLYHFFFNSKNS
jgi:hypothetical protein